MKKYEKYNNTEIPWIKKIPDNWKLIRIGSIFKERN